MKKELLAETAEQENTFWWYVGRLHVVERQLTRIASSNDKKALKILNVGSGTGGTIATLQKFGKVTNVDVSAEAIKFLKRHGHSAQLFDGRNLPYKNESFDVVVALDVIEHTPDDSAALVEWSRVLSKNGYLMITVPAHQWLWSSFDVMNHHYRRYSKKQLRALLERHSYSINKLSYSMVFSFPLVVGFRLIEHIRPPKPSTSRSNFVKVPAFINRFFIALLDIEGAAQLYCGMPFGSSLLAVGKK